MTYAPVLLNNNGAWCWFQDERALVDPAEQHAPGGIGRRARGARRRNTAAGNIEVAVLDLATGESKVHVLHEQLESDDHDAPALLIRPDGRYLAMYAKHKTDNYSRWRVSVRPHDASEWEPGAGLRLDRTRGRPRRHLFQPAPPRPLSRGPTTSSVPSTMTPP